MARDFTPWPCAELSQYPLADDWTDTFPMKKLSRLRYEHIKNAMRTLFMTGDFVRYNSLFRNYAFQQGEFTNANTMDLEFFYSMLSHDYPFFLGDKKIEIHTAFKLDPKKYQGMEFLRASHFDLFRVERATLGYCVLQSLTNPGIQPAFVSLRERPSAGDVIFARLMPVGLLPRFLGTSVVEPWDTVNPEHVESILEIYRRQYQAFCERYPDTSARAFMKIAGYHFYEAIQARELIPLLNNRIAPDHVQARTVTYRFAHRRDVPEVAAIPGAKPVPDAPGLATAPLCDLPMQTLPEAILSWDGLTLEVTMFMHDAGEKFLHEALEPCFAGEKPVRSDQLHDDNETYRSLRHLSLGRAI